MLLPVVIMVGLTLAAAAAIALIAWIAVNRTSGAADA
jgi:hypothetical protein